MIRRRLLRHARDMRSAQTDAEQILWYHLRARRFQGVKFRRQRPVGPYIVDFVCLESRLVLELDGGQHSEIVARDARRDAWLAANGYRVLRFWNNEVMQRLPDVLERIRVALEKDPLTPSPSPASGRGE